LPRDSARRLPVGAEAAGGGPPAPPAPSRRCPGPERRRLARPCCYHVTRKVQRADHSCLSVHQSVIAASAGARR
jgi:hypothetical protein